MNVPKSKINQQSVPYQNQQGRSNLHSYDGDATQSEFLFPVFYQFSLEIVNRFFSAFTFCYQF